MVEKTELKPFIPTPIDKFFSKKTLENLGINIQPLRVERAIRELYPEAPEEALQTDPRQVGFYGLLNDL